MNWLRNKKKKIISNLRSGRRNIKLFSDSTQLSMKFVMPISVKMPTVVVGILTFISRINTTGSLKARKR